MSWELGFRLPLWACAELFFLSLHAVHLSLLIPGQRWLLSPSLAGRTCVEASRLHAGLGAANEAGRYSEMPGFATALSGKAQLKPHSTAVGGGDQTLLKYLILWALKLSGGRKKSSHTQLHVSVLFLSVHSPSSSQPCVCSQGVLAAFNPAI